MTKIWAPVLLTVILAPGLAATGIAQGQRNDAYFIPASEVERVKEHLSPIYTDDEPLRVVKAGSYRVGLFVVGRPKKSPLSFVGTAVRVGEGLALDNVTSVIRIVRGRGTFVSGGRLVNAHPIATNDPDLPVIGPGVRGKLIVGGTRRQLSVGDVAIVPAHVAHGFSAVDSPLTYEVIRIDAGNSLPLKGM